MIDAGGVGDDERGPVKALRLAECLEGLIEIGAQRNLRHINAAVGHHHISKILLGALLAAGGKLRHRAGGGRLTHLTAGVGVDFGIKDQHIDICAGGKNMIQTAEADIVCPAIAAQDPVGFFGEELLVVQKLLRAGIKALGKDINEGIGGSKVGFAVLQCGKIVFQHLFFVRGFDAADQCFRLSYQTLPHGILRQIHAVAILGVILKEGISPRGPLTLFILGIGDPGCGAAPNGGAAGGIGDIHTGSEQLGEELGVGRFAAAGAGAGEFQKRLAELAALDGIGAEFTQNSRLGTQLPTVIKVDLTGLFALQTRHGKCLLALFAGANADAQVTAGAVHHADGDGKAMIGKTGHGQRGHTGRGIFRLLCRHGDGTNDRMGADQRAKIALNAIFGKPGGDLLCNAALFVLAGAQRQVAVLPPEEGGNRQVIALLQVGGDLDPVDILDDLGVASGGVEADKIAALGSPVRRDRYFLGVGKAALDGGVVHGDDVIALGAVGTSGGVLHQLQRFLGGNNAGKAEERRLQDGIDAPAQPQLLADGAGINGVEMDMVFGKVGLAVAGEAALQLLHAPAAVEQEDTARLDVMHHIVFAEVGGIVARHKIRLGDKVGGFDRLLAEAQVADGQAAALFGIIGEVALCVKIGVVTDDLDGIFVGADSAVGAETPELAADGRLRRGVGSFGLQQRKIGNIIGDADGKAGLFTGFSVAVHRKDLAGGNVFTAQTVASGINGGMLEPAAAQRRHHIKVQRLTDGAGLLGAIQHGDGFDGIGQGTQQMLAGEGTVQAHLDKTRLFAAGTLIINDLLDGLADRAHCHNDLLGVGIAVVVKKVVVAADHGIDLVHILLHHAREGIVELIGDLPLLEEDIGILGAAAQYGAVGGKPAVTEGIHCGTVHQRLQLFIAPNLDLLNLMGGAEAIEEVQKGDPALDSGKVGNGRKVHDLLHASGTQHGKAGLPAGVHIAVVAENGKGVGGKGARRAVNDAGQQLARHLVHIGDHEKKPLRGGKGGGKGACRQRAVYRTRNAALALHFNHPYRLPEQVIPSGGCPLIGQLRHDAGGGNGIDRRDIGVGVCHMRRGTVAVHRFHASVHQNTSRRQRGFVIFLTLMLYF